MERDGQHKTRHIVLGRNKTGSYIWTCTDCQWQFPFEAPNQAAAAPLEAINEFFRHTCAAKPQSRDGTAQSGEGSAL